MWSKNGKEWTLNGEKPKLLNVMRAKHGAAFLLDPVLFVWISQQKPSKETAFPHGYVNAGFGLDHFQYQLTAYEAEQLYLQLRKDNPTQFMAFDLLGEFTVYRADWSGYEI